MGVRASEGERERGAVLCLDARHMLDGYGQKICIFSQLSIMTDFQNCCSKSTLE